MDSKSLLTGKSCGELREAMDLQLEQGRFGIARRRCFELVSMGDTDSALRFIRDPRFSEPDYIEDWVDISFTRRIIVGTALERCPGFGGSVIESVHGDKHAAEVMSDALRFDAERADMYAECLEAALGMGSRAAMHLKASDILYPGFRGEHVSRIDEALDLLEASASEWWMSAVALGRIRFVGRYVDRDYGGALRCFAQACRLSDERIPLAWVGYMTGRAADGPGGFNALSEWDVLTDITASWSTETLYAPLANRWNCFEDSTFALGGSVRLSKKRRGAPFPALVFKPTGLAAYTYGGPSGEMLSEPLPMDGFREVLGLCIGSAAESIRGLEA